MAPRQAEAFHHVGRILAGRVRPHPGQGRRAQAHAGPSSAQYIRLPLAARTLTASEAIFKNLLM